MVVYFVMLTAVSLIYVASKRRRTLFFFCTWVLILLLLGLRDPSVGIDVNSYLNIYHHVTERYIDEFVVNPSLGFLFGNDILYFLFSYLLLLFGASDQIFLFANAAVTTSIMMYFLWKYSKNDYICVLTFLSLGCYLFFFTALRQSLALAICCYASMFIVEKKPIRFIIAVIVAAGFHSSALAFLPAYLVVQYFRRRNIYYSIAFLLVGSVFASLFYEFLFQLFAMGRFSVYEGNPTKTSFLLIVLHLGLLLVCTLLYKPREVSIDSNEETGVFLILFAFSVGILILSLQNTIISRMALYYNLGLPILLANSLKGLANRESKVASFAMCITGELMFLLVTASNSYSGIVHYKFFWQ